jgi:drug/metabolite transporter (DMT)-like permease
MLTRKIDRALPPMITAFYTGMSFVLIAGILSLIFGFGAFTINVHPSLDFLTRGWVMPGLSDGLTIFAVGVLTVSGFFGYAQAYRLASPSFIAPFEYSSMIWAILFGYLFFKDVPTGETVVGAAIIIAAGLFLGWQERRLWRR